MACHYNALARRGITVDFVNQESDLTGYGLVIVPMQYLLRNKFAQALCDYTAQGGTVVVTYWTGVVDESDLCYLGDTCWACAGRRSTPCTMVRPATVLPLTMARWKRTAASCARWLP